MSLFGRDSHGPALSSLGNRLVITGVGDCRVVLLEGEGQAIVDAPAAKVSDFQGLPQLKSQAASATPLLEKAGSLCFSAFFFGGLV